MGIPLRLRVPTQKNSVIGHQSNLMNDLNTAHILRQLWEKLPRYLKGKWTERNNKTKSTKGRMANFQEFAEFVREQADLATDPVFSDGIMNSVTTEDKGKAITQPRFSRRVPVRS